MIVGRATSPGIKDRFFRLEVGIHSVGSGLGCDIVLLDKSILEHHLTLHVSAETVEVELAEGATAEFRHLLGARLSCPRAGERREWYLGDKLHIADVCIEIQGVVPERPPTKAADVAKPLRPATQRLFSVSGSLMAGFVFASALFSGESGTPANRACAVEQKTAAAGGIPDTEAVRSRLRALGLEPEGLTRRATNWTAVLRVADDAERHALDDKLALLDFPFEPEVYVDRQLKKAADLAISTLGGKVRIVSVDRGVLTLSEVQGEQTANMVEQILTRDVPGLARVQVQASHEASLAQIRARVSGVWLGDFPYVVLTDNSVVHAGGELSPGVKLIAVRDGAILVDIGGREQKVSIQ